MYSQEEISSALSCLRVFRQGYKEENGTINIGDIRDLIDKIDLIEYCVKKQKNIPADRYRYVYLFGKKRQATYCKLCGGQIKYGRFCPICGQKFC